MSRVDEALQRAREQADAAAARTGVSPIGEDRDVAAFAHEPFPVENVEARLVPPPAVAAAAVAVPALTEFPAERPQPVVLGRSAEPSPLAARVSETVAEKTVVDDKMLSESREQYRRLAATLHHAQLARGIKVVLVTSAVTGEGKTLTASNLALTFSESYDRSVLLIDADLRRPELHAVFSLPPGDGLCEGVKDAGGDRIALRRVSPRLSVLPGGTPTADPMAGLISDRLRRLVEEARATFDWIIIDTPPVGLLPDAHLLNTIVDGAIVVVKAGSTPYELVKGAVDALGRDKVLGVVLNRAARTGRFYGYSYYDNDYYYAPAAPPPRPS